MKYFWQSLVNVLSFRINLAAPKLLCLHPPRPRYLLLQRSSGTEQGFLFFHQKMPLNTTISIPPIYSLQWFPASITIFLFLMAGVFGGPFRFSPVRYCGCIREAPLSCLCSSDECSAASSCSRFPSLHPSGRAQINICRQKINSAGLPLSTLANQTPSKLQTTLAEFSRFG